MVSGWIEWKTEAQRAGGSISWILEFGVKGLKHNWESEVA